MRFHPSTELFQLFVLSPYTGGVLGRTSSGPPLWFDTTGVGVKTKLWGSHNPLTPYIYSWLLGQRALFQHGLPTHAGTEKLGGHKEVSALGPCSSTTLTLARRTRFDPADGNHRRWHCLRTVASKRQGADRVDNAVLSSEWRVLANPCTPYSAGSKEGGDVKVFAASHRARTDAR